MPLTPKYSWSETAETVEVHVQVPGAAKCAPDILVADCVLKVNAPPYLLVLDLNGEVDEAQSTARVDAQGIAFQLRKVGCGLRRHGSRSRGLRGRRRAPPARGAAVAPSPCTPCTLPQRKPGAWDALVYAGGKQDAAKRRDQAIERAYAAQEAQRQKKLEQRKAKEAAAKK